MRYNTKISFFRTEIFINKFVPFAVMAEKRLTPKEIAQIIKMRGLGYNQAEIAEALGVSQSAVQYQLRKIKQRAQEEGDDDTWLSLLLAAGIGAGVGLGAGLLLAKLFEKK